MTNDSDDFSAEMAKKGILPLSKRQGKAQAQPLRRDINIQALRQAAASDLPQGNDPGHYLGIEWLGPHDIVEYRSSGIQHAVFKKLKQGHYDIDADIDLHGYRIEDAKIALFQFVHTCMQQGIRCAIVVHGKGWHSGTTTDPAEAYASSNKPVSRLKSHVVHWLKSIDEVQAYSSAQPKDGGTGAVYVLFKKSEKAREKDRRHFGHDEN